MVRVMGWMRGGNGLPYISVGSNTCSPRFCALAAQASVSPGIFRARSCRLYHGRPDYRAPRYPFITRHRWVQPLAGLGQVRCVFLARIKRRGLAI